MIPKQRVTVLQNPVTLAGITALVVGATAGIGRAVAEQFASAGATTILAGRDPTKLKLAADELAAMSGRICTQCVDLADLGSVRSAAAALCDAFPKLDIVIANASVMTSGRQRSFTRDGFETTIGVNHLGNAALLLGLEQPIRAAKARLIIVASEAHRRAGGLPMDDLMGEHRFDGPRAYARSKLANILFARQLAERWPEVTIYAAHPGGVLTGMMHTATSQNMVFRALFRLMKSALLSPAQAAAGLFRIAVDPDLTAASGAYFELGRPDAPGRLANDQELARRLFERTLALVSATQAPPLLRARP